MAAAQLSPRAVTDLERIFEFIAERDPTAALATIRDVREAVQILAHHPLIGRLVDTHRRELIISKGRTGYVALYRWFEATDTALVLRIRHQREAGYAGD
ncbi:MAG: type II toxin-antitoxin system RelE/ParE family toxin [Gammaproteobacteria bacterium]